MTGYGDGASSGVIRGLAAASATVAITVYGASDRGYGYETTLFARDIGTVWTALVSPVESSVASASPSALSSLLDAALAVVE